MSGAGQRYHTLYHALQPCCGQGRTQNLKTLALLMVGIFQSGAVRLGRLAPKPSLDFAIASVTQRFRRFLKNPRLDEPALYTPILRQGLAGLYQTRLYLHLDRPLIGVRFNVLSVRVYVRNRALPVAWVLLPHGGCSDRDDWRPLGEQVTTLLPADTPVLLLGDRECGGVGLMDLAQELGWDDCLRVKGSNHIGLPETGQGGELRALTPAEGETYCLTASYFTKGHAYLTHLVIAYAGDDPCFIVTNRLSSRRTLPDYGRRFGGEPLFSDLKPRGFDLERSQLVHAGRFGRLFPAVALLTVWVWTVARRVQVTGQAAARVGSGCETASSLFQVGYRWLPKQLTWGRSLIPDPGFAFWHFVRK